MKSVTLEEAEARLTDLLLHLIPGEELTITVDGLPFARVQRTVRECTTGWTKTGEYWMAPDFDAPMDEYGNFAK